MLSIDSRAGNDCSFFCCRRTYDRWHENQFLFRVCCWTTLSFQKTAGTFWAFMNVAWLYEVRTHVIERGRLQTKARMWSWACFRHSLKCWWDGLTFSGCTILLKFPKLFALLRCWTENEKLTWRKISLCIFRSILKSQCFRNLDVRRRFDE